MCSRLSARHVASCVLGVLLAFFLTTNVAQGAVLEILVSAGDAGQIRTWQSLAREYQREKPDTRVQITFLPPMEIEEKLLVASAGGISIDGVYWVTESLSKFAGRGLLRNLTPYVPQSVLEAYIPVLHQGMTHNGEIVGLPIVASSQALFYNRDLFDEAGVAPLQATDDWDTFVEKMRRLTLDKDGDNVMDQWGFTWFAALIREWLNWVWQNGGDIYDAGGTTFQLDQPEAVEAIQFLADLSNRYGVAPPGPALRGAIWEHFFSGRAAVYPSGAWDTFFITSANQGLASIDVAHYPRRTHSAAALDMFVLSVPKLSQHPEEAAAFATWLSSSPTAQELMYNAGWGIPATLEIANELWLDPASSLNRAIFLEAFAWGRFVPYGGHWSDVSPVLMPVLADILDGVADPGVALAEVKPRIDAILNR